MSASERANSFQMSPEVPKLVPRSNRFTRFPVHLGIQLVLAGAILATIAVQLVERRTILKAFNEKQALVLAELKTTQAAVRSSFDENFIFLKILHLQRKLDHKMARIIAIAIAENARAFDRDPDFILSIMAQESNYDPNAVSTAGAVGLMQIMPPWLKIVGQEEDLTIPAVNVRRGCQIYAFYENEFGNNTEMALMAYNRGSGAVWKDMADGRNWKRNGYADKVMKTYNKLKKLSN